MIMSGSVHLTFLLMGGGGKQLYNFDLVLLDVMRWNTTFCWMWMYDIDKKGVD